MPLEGLRDAGRNLHQHAAHHQRPEPQLDQRTIAKRGFLAAIGLGIVVIWSYWPVLVGMWNKWSTSPQYSHSYLVPLFALYLLKPNRAKEGAILGKSTWWGLPVLFLGLCMRLAGSYISFDWLEAISLLPVLAGATLLIAGWPALRHCSLAIGFLIFMIPLPHKIETGLSLPLQRTATLVSTYVLQTVGLPAIAEGNVILINDSRIGVVEACNGLGMLLLFFAMATAVAILVKRNWIIKAIIIASALPIAIIANVARISAVGLLADLVGSEWLNRLTHDLAGWVMMPFALLLLWLELCVLSRLFIEDDDALVQPKVSKKEHTSLERLSGLPSESDRKPTTAGPASTGVQAPATDKQLPSALAATGVTGS